MDLTGKVVLITGAAQGIGEAAARLCAARGARVVMADIKTEAGQNAAAAIRAQGGDAHFETVDVRNEEQVQHLFTLVRERYGRLDALVCAAGVLKGAFLQPEEFPTDLFEQVIDINVMGTFLCVKYATPLLADSGRGVIVLIASGAGVKGGSSSLAYGTSKGGVNGLGMTLERHLAPRNIRVNVLCPGAIATEMKLENIADAARQAGQSPEEALAEAETWLGLPDGVGRVIAFLVSEDADYVRGTLFTR